jgi:hypothetical protein
MFIAQELSKHFLAPSGAKYNCRNIPLLTELEQWGARLTIDISLLTELKSSSSMRRTHVKTRVLPVAWVRRLLRGEC